MGYATVMNVPRIHNYAGALRKYNNTKPIRGRADDPRPLGERKDVDMYSIRKNVWTDAVECILYKTPVVKFTTDGEVIINIDNWPSASTCQFISRVLQSVNANRVRGEVVLSFSDNSKGMLPAQGELTLVKDSNGRWVPKVKQKLYDYRVSRKEANNVRKQVSQFRDYLVGVVKLKSEKISGVYGREGFSAVEVTYGELIEVFGCRDSNDPLQYRPNSQGWEKLTDKPHKFLAGDSKVRAWASYRENSEKFFDLVRNDQDDGARHQNYWIAFNVLMIQGQNLYWQANTDFSIALDARQFDKFLEKILFTLFADKVFERVTLPGGKVPTGRYCSYVRTEED